MSALLPYIETDPYLVGGIKIWWAAFFLVEWNEQTFSWWEGLLAIPKGGKTLYAAI